MKFLNVKKITEENAINKAIEEERKAIAFEIDQKFNDFLEEIEDVTTDMSIDLGIRTEIIVATAKLYKGLCNITGNIDPNSTERNIPIEEDEPKDLEQLEKEIGDELEKIHATCGSKMKSEDDFVSLTELIVDKGGRIYIDKSVITDADLNFKYLKLVNKQFGKYEIILDDYEGKHIRWDRETIKYLNTIEKSNIRLGVQKLLNVKPGDYVLVKAYKNKLVIFKN